jgi:hypothetical protein
LVTRLVTMAAGKDERAGLRKLKRRDPAIQAD